MIIVDTALAGPAKAMDPVRVAVVAGGFRVKCIVTDSVRVGSVAAPGRANSADHFHGQRRRSVALPGNEHRRGHRGDRPRRIRGPLPPRDVTARDRSWPAL
jgi:hypothetical protein